MKYIKINSLYKRDANKKLIVGDYSKPEYANIKNWTVHEKIDGTNIRIMYDKNDNGVGNITFGGRTDNSEIPKHLLAYLQIHFTVERIEQVFPDTEFVILYGEGYGPKIQEPIGSKYADEVGFILFDVRVGRWWLQQNDVLDIAKQLNIPHTPLINVSTLDNIFNYVKSKPLSLHSKRDQIMEGVIARPDPFILHRDGSPIIFKLKCKDLAHLNDTP